MTNFDISYYTNEAFVTEVSLYFFMPAQHPDISAQAKACS